MQDKSSDKNETWEFVERRIADVMTVGQVLNKNQSIVSAVGNGTLSILKGVFVPPKRNDAEILNK